MLNRTIVFLMLGILLFPFNDVRAIKPDHSYAVKPKETPKKVVRDFLTWYKNNRENLQKYVLVPVNTGDSVRAYRVDFKEADKYLNELKKSGFVSDKYIASFRKYFEESDANLEKYPQYDGTPNGFGFDLVLKASDHNEILGRLSKIKIITKPVNAETAKVYIRFPTVVMALTLTRSGKTWLIDSLDYV